MSELLRNIQQVPKRWKYLNFVDYILPFYILCTIPMFYMGWHIDFVFKGFTILITLLFFLKFGPGHTKGSNLFMLFIFLVLFSFIQYLYNDVPIECYFSDAPNYVAAMLFFFIGVRDDRPGRSFYNKFLFAATIVFVLGLICYVLTPSWYLSRYVEIANSNANISYNDFNEETILTYLRFSAFFGESYSISHYSVYAAAISVFYVGYNSGRKRIISIVLLVIAVVSSIACMHRASIVGSVICIMMFMLFNHKTYQRSTNILIFVLGVLAIIAVLLFVPSMNDRMTGITDMLTSRVDDNMNLGKALDERKNTQELMGSMRFFMFGHGVGSGSPYARQYGFPGIADMQYVKMFFENGMVGAILFLLIIANALIIGFRNMKYYLTEVSIILFVLVAMLGSNSLSIYYFIVFPFWYAVGRIYNNNYLNSLKNKEWIY